MKTLSPAEYATLRDLERMGATGFSAIVFSSTIARLEAREYVSEGEVATCPFCGGKHPVGYVVTELGKAAMRCYEALHRPSPW